MEGFPYSSVGKESTCNAGDPGSIPGSGRSPGEGIGYPLQYTWASLVAQLVKNLPAMQETWIQSLGWEGPLEKETAREFHGLYSPWGRKESDMSEQLSLSQVGWNRGVTEGHLKCLLSCCFSCSVMSDSLQPHKLRHAMFPCPSLSPRVCPNSYLLSHDATQPSYFQYPPFPPVLNLSQHQGLSSESALCIRCPKYWSFSLSPSSDYSGLISFTIDWFDLLAVQGTLQSPFQHHNMKASILWCSVFFMVNSYIHTWLLEKP